MSPLALSELFKASLFRTGDVETAIREVRARVRKGEELLTLVAQVTGYARQEILHSRVTAHVHARWALVLLLHSAGYNGEDMLRAFGWDSMILSRARARRGDPEVERIVLTCRARSLA